MWQQYNYQCQTIIAIRVDSLSSATMANANEIYLLVYNSGTSLIINSSGINYNTTIYIFKTLVI